MKITLQFALGQDVAIAAIVPILPHSSVHIHSHRVGHTDVHVVV